MKLIVSLFFGGTLMFGQQIVISEAIRPLLSSSDDTVPTQVRNARGALYDRDFSVFDVPRFGAPPVTMVTLEEFEELPATKSDLVAIGEVISSQPFASKNGRGLYTEYTVRTIDAIKSAAAKPSPTSFVMLRAGGITRLNDGRIVKDEVRGAGDPVFIGKQYLLFLSYLPDTDAYFPIKIWHIQQDRTLKAAFPDDHARVARKESQFDGRLIDIAVDTLRGRGAAQ
jgi:hypothetical protein